MALAVVASHGAQKALKDLVRRAKDVGHEHAEETVPIEPSSQMPHSTSTLFFTSHGAFLLNALGRRPSAPCPSKAKRNKKNAIPDSRKSLYLQAQFALDLIDAADKAMSKDQVDGAGPASHEGVASPVHAHLQKLGVGHK